MQSSAKPRVRKSILGQGTACANPGGGSVAGTLRKGRWAGVAEAQGTGLGLARNEAGRGVEARRGQARILSLE